MPTAVPTRRARQPFQGRPQPRPIRHPPAREVCGMLNERFEIPKVFSTSCLLLNEILQGSSRPQNNAGQ